MVKRIALLTVIAVMLSLGSGCELKSDGTESENHLYASWHNNLNSELVNFNKGFELITACTEKEINSDNLRNLYYTMEMFTDTNNLFVLRGLMHSENIPENLRNKLISPEVVPHVTYMFETVDTLNEINKKILDLSDEYREAPLPEKQKELVQAFYQNLNELNELYRDVGHDITQADLSDRCIEELQKIHLINENIMDLLPHLCQC
ncbi:MAG: hypothetical protein ACN4A7_01320 [Thermacetogeniaceae bacterium]|nr:hypothetical protein [Thermoanaerobacterales bacterium]